MSHISVRGEQSTSTEITALANLAALAASGAGEFIRKTGATTFENATPGSDSIALGDLTDVTITSIASGELIKWNGSAWINNTLAEAGIANSTLSNLGTVAINASLLFDTDATYDIGSATVGLNDLHFGSGGVINFDGSDVTITHSANTLTIAGGVLAVPDAGLTINSLPFAAADAGADAIYGWDDSAGQYENLTQAEARTVLGLGTAALVATDLSDLNEATIEAAIDTLANLTSIQGHTVTLTGAFIRSGVHSLTLTTTSATDVTLPTTGTLLANVSEDTTPQLGGNLDAMDKNITGVGRVSFTQELDNGSKTASFSVDFATDQKQKATLTANTITLTLDTTSVGVGNYILKLVNGGLATLTWASETGSILWPGGTEPTLSSSGTDVVSFYFDGTNWYGQAGLNFS